MVEHFSCKEDVIGSIPIPGSLASRVHCPRSAEHCIFAATASPCGMPEAPNLAGRLRRADPETGRNGFAVRDAGGRETGWGALPCGWPAAPKRAPTEVGEWEEGEMLETARAVGNALRRAVE